MHVARTLLVFSIAATSALVCAACSSSSGDDAEKYSDTYQLNEINASYGAFADEGNLHILAAILGPKGFLRTRAGDTFEIDVNGARVPNTERVDDNGKVHYIADISPAPPPDTEVAITFVRNLERVKTTIKIYKAFNIKNPPTTVKVGQAVPIEVDPAPDLSQWPGFFGPGLNAKAEVVGDCLETGSQQFDLCSMTAPPGKCEQGYPLKFDAAKLIPKAGANGCDIAVQVRLNSGGSKLEGIGPAKQNFKGGGFEGYRLKSFHMQLTP